MSSEGIRARRVAESVRAYLAGALSRDIGDPRLAGVVVTDVGLPDDLSVAWVRVRRMTAGEATPAVQREVMAALQRAAGKLRRGLGPAIRLKRVPELRFAYDTGQDSSERVDELLREIAAEKKSQE